MKIKVGSRESRLAVIQSEIIIKSMRESNPEMDTELITMKTTGDKILDRTLDKIGGKGLFVKELDRALLTGKVDITVHSLKDMPIEDNYRFPIMAYSKRENPFDALVLPKGENEIHGAIGCASSRRAVQLKKLYPDIEVRPVRGNVLTRLNKLDSGEYGALVLACAGLERLGMSDRISRVFNEDEMLPAAGQGIIAVQGRAGEDFSYLDGVDCYESRLCAIAERAFIRELDGGCSSPVAAFAKIQNEGIVLKGMNVKNDEPLFGSICGSFEEAEEIGKILAGRLK